MKFFRNEIKQMTIKVSESFSATGAEFSIDLEKLKKLIDKNAIAVLAKVQECFQLLKSANSRSSYERVQPESQFCVGFDVLFFRLNFKRISWSHNDYFNTPESLNG